jgi:rubrerythrin
MKRKDGSHDNKPRKPGRPRKNGAVTPAVTSLKRRVTVLASELDPKKPKCENSAVILTKLQELEKALNECRGTENILKSKILKQTREKLLQQLAAVSNGNKESEMFDYLATIDRIEKSTGTNELTGASKVIPLSTQLTPLRAAQRNILDTMSSREALKWQDLRAHKKRYAIMFDKEHPKIRMNHIDTCADCLVDLVVDREMATAVCPNCGKTRQFASHIFESKEMERDDTSSKQQSLNHMQKFSAQFLRGQSATSTEVLESLSTAYGRIHVHDASKVQSCRTSTLLKGLHNIPKSVRRIPDRLTKELKAEGIPEFTSAQVQELLSLRNRLRVPEDVAAEALVMDAHSSDGVTGYKSRKSFNNQIFMRQLGRSSGMEPARLFPNPKTNRIHMERTRTLEQECVLRGVMNSESSNWALYPAS